LVSEQPILGGSIVLEASMAVDTSMNQLTEYFGALKKTVEKDEAQAKKNYTDLLKKMEGMQTNYGGDKKFEQIMKNFTYLTQATEMIK
jgi:hypothetical protein